MQLPYFGPDLAPKLVAISQIVVSRKKALNSEAQKLYRILKLIPYVQLLKISQKFTSQWLWTQVQIRDQLLMKITVNFLIYIIDASAKSWGVTLVTLPVSWISILLKCRNLKAKIKKQPKSPLSSPAWSTVKVKHLREGWRFVCWVALSGWILFGCLGFRVLVSFTLSHTERAIVHFTSNHVLMWKGKMTVVKIHLKPHNMKEKHM